MKKLIWLLMMAALLLGACSGNEEPPASNSQEVPAESETNEPTQEELNEQVKADAVEIEFTKANAAEYEEGTRVKATGEVSFKDDLTFTLTTDEGEGSGMYEITYADTTGATFEDGDTVTVYGTYNGKAEGTGMPSVMVTIIEPNQ